MRCWVLIGLLALSCAKPQEPPPEKITIAVAYEIDSLDPHARNTLSNFAIASNFYEPLVRTDAGMKIQPCLARLWENPDHLTWIFHLQPSARFHSGKRMTSADVIYSLRRLMNNPVLEMSSYLTDISDIRAEGPSVVRIHTMRPMNILLNKLRFVPIIPDGMETESLQQNIDGTGPYRLVKWNRGESIEMARNEHYWGEKAHLSRATLLLGHPPEKALASLLAGKCQFAQTNSRDLEKSIKGNTKFEIHKNDSLFLKFIGFDVVREETPFCNVKPNPFKNPLVRKAIHIGLDRKALIRTLPIYAVPATQPLPPFVFGYNPEIRPPEHSIQNAQALMQQAGLSEGFDVTMHARANVMDAAVAAKEQLSRIGIRIDIKTSPAPEFLAAMKRHEYSFFFAGMGCPTGDASDILDSAFHSVQLDRRYGVMNYGQYSNPQVDRAVEESSQIQRMDKRRDAIQSIMAMVMEDLAWIPVYIDQDAYAVERIYKWKPRNDSFIFVSEIQTK